MATFFYRPRRPEPVLLRLLGDGIDIAVAVLGASLITVMTANVISRVALNADIAWNTEFGEFTLVWATFLGGAAAARRGAHMSITEILQSMRPKLAWIVNLATRVAVIGLLALLVQAGANIVGHTMDQQMSVLYWPVGVQYLAMPVGSGLALVFVVYELWVVARGGAPFGSEAE